MDILQTSRLVLREFNQADIDNLYLLLSDPVVMKYCSGPLDMAGTRRWLDAVIACYKKYGYDYWAVYEKNTDEFIGQIGIMNQEIDGQPEDCLAYMIGRKYWNKGYATEGAASCIDYALQTLKLKKLIATVEPENLQSIRILKKLGMKYIGDADYLKEMVQIYSTVS